MLMTHEFSTAGTASATSQRFGNRARWSDAARKIVGTSGTR